MAWQMCGVFYLTKYQAILQAQCLIYGLKVIFEMKGTKFKWFWLKLGLEIKELEFLTRDL